MIYRIVSYDRMTERMKGSLIIPPSVLGQVKTARAFSRKTTAWVNIRWTRTRPGRSRPFWASGGSRTNSITLVEPFDPPEDRLEAVRD